MRDGSPQRRAVRSTTAEMTGCDRCINSSQAAGSPVSTHARTRTFRGSRCVEHQYYQRILSRGPMGILTPKHLCLLCREGIRVPLSLLLEMHPTESHNPSKCCFVDPHQMCRDALASLIGAAAEFQVLGERPEKRNRSRKPLPPARAGCCRYGHGTGRRRRYAGNGRNPGA